MPEFQSKASKFTHKGMQWNTPTDAIPEGQVAFAKNLRINQQGTVTQRPGMTDIRDLGGTYIHSISRLNNYDPNVNFSRGYVIGQDDKLYFGAAQFAYGTEAQAMTDISASLVDAARNPLKLPNNAALSFNPLTMVDMAPVGSTSGWKFIGDKNLNLAVGFYPGDNPGSNMARAITMGMRPPVFMADLNVQAPGNLNGTYQWVVAYRNKWTGARSNPSAPSREDFSTTPGKILNNEKVTFLLPTCPINPQTGSPDSNIVLDVYRFGGTIHDWRYVGTGDGGTGFTDNMYDKEILTAPSPPQLTDANGITRFNLYQPFITQDIARFNSPSNLGRISLSAHGTIILNANGSDTFNLGILPGSPISVNYNVWSIYQVLNNKQIELAEDTTGNLTDGMLVPWAIQAGTLVAGSPLSKIWGPYGTGQGGAYIFGVGDPNNAGTLFWTNGNDPDSTDLVNSLIVTSPSEPLRGGCVYDGTPFVWSTERMFRVYPGNVAGQFTVQEIPGSKGLWADYSLTVQSNGVSDQSISWVGKDGIYDWSTSGGLRTLTDRDLYPFFPHDNQKGIPLATIFPFLNETFPVGAPDYTVNPSDASLSRMKYHRLTWFHNELFYDFADTAGKYHALVFDAKECQGWVSLDQYQGGAGTVCGKPMARCSEIAANNMLLGLGGEFLTYTGTQDSGHDIACRLVTRADDQGDPRAMKLYGDYMVDTNTNGVSVSCTAYANAFTQQLTTTPILTPTRRQVIAQTFSTLGAMGRSFGLDYTWTATALVTLFQSSFSYVPKPEVTDLRVTDKTDDGYNGPKYLRGLCVEAITNGSRDFNVLVDNVVAGQLTIATLNSQLEIPYAITPTVGSEFQLQPINNSDGHLWQIFQVRWIWEKWPDLTAIESNWLDLGTIKPKYIRSFSIPVAGANNLDLGFTVTYDGGTVYNTTTTRPLAGDKRSSAQYSFYPPIVAHQLKLAPTVPCRAWYDNIVWDAEEWPELAKMYGPVEKLGDSGAKYLRGLELPIETAGASVGMKLQYDWQSSPGTGSARIENFPPLTTSTNNKVVFPLTPSQPIIAHEFQLFSDSPARFWYSEIKWDYEQWPEFDTGWSAWHDGGTVSAKFVRGITVPIDTGGMPVSFTIHTDVGADVTFGPFTTDAGSKTAVYCGFAVPLIMHEFQIQPITACRFWYDEIKWDADPWPEYEVESSGWLDNGTPSAKYIRGITMPIDTATTSVTFDLYTDTGQVVAFGPFTTQMSVKTSVYCSFPVPLIIHQFRIQPRSNCRCWYGEIKWDADPWPELETQSSAWGDAGYQGAKFVQGVLIPMDTAGASITFDVLYDQTNDPSHSVSGTVPAGPFSTPSGQKTTVGYSFPVPFIAHNLMVTPRAKCYVWNEEIKWIWEPVPELVTTYTTQETDLDLPGYGYQFDAYIAYIGTALPPVFTVTTEYGAEVYNLPASNGVFTRTHIMLKPQKAKWRRFSVTCPTGIRLFLKDCEVRAKNWSDKGNYPSAFTSHHPMGEESRVIGARI